MTLLSKKLEKYRGEVWWFPLLPKYDHLRQAVGSYVLAFEGKPYDFKSLFRNIFGRVSLNAKALFCSEIAFYGYRKANIVSGSVAPRPSDLAAMRIYGQPMRLI